MSNAGVNFTAPILCAASCGQGLRILLCEVVMMNIVSELRIVCHFCSRNRSKRVSGGHNQTSFHSGVQFAVCVNWWT